MDRVNQDAAIRRLSDGGLVWGRSPARRKAGLHLDCTWIGQRRRAYDNEPAIADRSRAPHPCAAQADCRGKKSPRAALRRLRVRLSRRVRRAAAEIGVGQPAALAHRLAVPEKVPAG